MKKFMLGGLAAAAVIAPIALTAGSASAATTTANDPACVPVTAKAAVAEVNHVEYKYKPRVNGTGPTHWALSEQGTNITVNGVAYVRDGVKTQTIIDSPAVAAVDAVTCPTTVTFKNSKGELLAGGDAWVVAPAGNWISLGTTGTTGTVSAELAPGSYQFVMDYLGARQSKPVEVGAGGATVDFQTASATVTFKNSKGELLAGGDAWVVAPAGNWISLGTTGTTGTVSAELAPGSYQFVMDYLGARQSKPVEVGAGGATVDFQTASATVTFKNSKGELLAGGDAWVVAPAGNWISLGTTGTTGTVSAELAPGSYQFVMDYLGARQSKPVEVGASGATVDFNTYRVEVRGQTTNAAGTKAPVLDGTWWYVSPDGGWHTIGEPDTNGDAITQLLPGTYTFVHVADDDTRHTFPNVTIAANGRKVLPFVG